MPRKKTVDFRLLAKDGPVALNRKNVYISPYVEEPLNSKVIKSFVPELRSRKCFSCFEIPMFYVYMLWTFYVRFTYPYLAMVQYVIHYTTEATHVCWVRIRVENKNYYIFFDAYEDITLFTNLAAWAGYDTRSIFKLSSTGEGATPFSGLLHFTLDTYFILLSVKQEGIKYHFKSIWYDTTWDWTYVSWTIGEYSAH